MDKYEDMSARLMTPEDKELWESWFVRKGEVVPSSWGYKDCYGLMVLSNKTPACGGWMIPTQAGWCLIEFIQTNPDLLSFTQAKAYRCFIDVVIGSAEELGFSHIGGFVKESLGSIRKLYENGGGSKTEPVNYFFMEVGANGT